MLSVCERERESEWVSVCEWMYVDCVCMCVIDVYVG